MLPKELFDYARNYQKKHTAQYPTFRQAAKHFGVTLDAVEQACEDWLGPEYMQPVVAFIRGKGVESIGQKADWLIEAYN